MRQRHIGRVPRQMTQILYQSVRQALLSELIPSCL
jgi:hypothetical protein